MDDVVRIVQESLRSSTGSSANVLTLLATLLVTVVIALTLVSRRKRLPPGPFAWPVVGNFPALGGGPPHHVLGSLAAKYGGLIYLRLGSVPTIVVSTVAVSKELFQAHDATFLDRPKRLALDIVTENYKNMGVASGLYWRQLRKLCASELFTAKRIATYKTVREEEIHNIMKELREDAGRGSAVNLKSCLLGITSNNMTRMLTNKRYFGDGVDSKKEIEDFEVVLARTFDIIGTLIISDFVPYLGFVNRLQGWKKKFEDLRDFNMDVAGRMFEIEKHRQRAAERRLGDEGTYVPDFVDLLLRTPLDDGKILPDKNLTIVLMDMINAGTETSAMTVEWAMAELMRRPEIMQRLQDELSTVIGTDRPPQESDIPKLPFLQAVVKENFRLHPPIAINLPRESTQEFEFQGFKLPKKTMLLLNFYAIHRDPAVYENPDEFKPERFVEHPEVNQLAGFDSYELTPFSAGRRMCPAAELGNMMVCLMLAHLVHSFDWSLPKGEGVEAVDMSEHTGITVSLKVPLRLIAKAKTPASLY